MSGMIEVSDDLISLKVKALLDFKSNIDVFNREIASAVLKVNMLRIFRSQKVFHSNVLISKVPEGTFVYKAKYQCNGNNKSSNDNQRPKRYNSRF